MLGIAIGWFESYHHIYASFIKHLAMEAQPSGSFVKSPNNQSFLYINQFFFKENVRKPISLILGTRVGPLKRLEKNLA